MVENNFHIYLWRRDYYLTINKFNDAVKMPDILESIYYNKFIICK